MKISLFCNKIPVIASFFFIPVEYKTAYLSSGKSKIFFLSNSDSLIEECFTGILQPVCYNERFNQCVIITNPFTTPTPTALTITTNNNTISSIAGREINDINNE